MAAEIPEDQRCGAIISVGDDHGDNSATFHCKLTKGHPGRHAENWLDNTATITWEKDERHQEREPPDNVDWRWRDGVANGALEDMIDFHTQCKTATVRNEKYDAIYCPKCDLWLEEKCGSDECEFCFGRPDKPSEIKP